METALPPANIWKQGGWYFEARTAEEVMVAIGRLGAHSVNHRFAWRGLSNLNYPLTSSLHRFLERKGEKDIAESNLRAWEKKILGKARDWGLGVEGGSMVDDLQLLADLQHFGVPTRLIDVTSNPMTALWFASKETFHSDGRRASGILVALNINRWYKKNESVFSTIRNPDVVEGGLSRQLELGLNLQSPFVVSSAIPNVRLRAQEGYFVACSHPDCSRQPLTSLNIEIMKPDRDIRKNLTEYKKQGLPAELPYLAIKVPSNHKESIRTYLHHSYSKSWETLFPDYQGLSEYINGGFFDKVLLECDEKSALICR